LIETMRSHHDESVSEDLGKFGHNEESYPVSKKGNTNIWLEGV